MKSNQVTLSGTIASEFTFSHELFGEKFYTVFVAVARTSETIDLLPVMFSDRMIDVKMNYTDKPIRIFGQFRSYNMPDTHRNRLILNVFALDYEWMDEKENANTAILEGYICKPPIYRKTPLGREIADVMLAVNRPYGKSDYIPCICWGRNARYAESLEVGECIQIYGRIQSREYKKKIGDTEERRIAYEVSVSKMETVA